MINLNFHIVNKDIFENKVTEFIDIINKALKSNVPAKKLKFKNPDIPKHIKKIISLKNHVRKRVQKKPTVPNKLLLEKFDKYVRFSLNKLQSKHFEKFSNSLSFADGSIWKFANKYSKKSETSTTLYNSAMN